MRTSLQDLPGVDIKQTISCVPGIADLWFYVYGDSDNEELLATQEAILAAGERERRDQFYFERDRRQFVAARALLRTVLSKYFDVSPKDWRFATTEHGKPSVCFPAVSPPIYFNVAHTRGLVACAMSIAHEQIGVDVELTSRRMEALSIAERQFSSLEFRAIQAVDESEQLKSFYTYWTLKEAYIKARGLGLTIPLDGFSFLINNDAIAVRFDKSLGDDEKQWRFAVTDLSPAHTIAIAVRTDGGAMSLRASRFVPQSYDLPV